MRCCLTQIAAGEPLLLSYGPLSNDFLLMDYGFVIPGNPHDRVALRFDMNLINVCAEQETDALWCCLLAALCLCCVCG